MAAINFFNHALIAF